MANSDRYATFDYRSLISWDERLRREWPFFEAVFHSVPSKHLLDLGSGTGEHARLLASQGFEVTGVDSSPAMIEKAAGVFSRGVQYVQGDMRELDTLLDDRFGGAICVGNVLPHLKDDADLARLVRGLRAVLMAGAAAVLQLLNYDRIQAKKERALPLSFLPDPADPAAKLLFLRIIEPLDSLRFTFMPTVLRVRPDRDVPVELLGTERVEVRGWRRPELEAAFREGGFDAVEVYGSYQKAAFEPAESRDLILVAR